GSSLLIIAMKSFSGFAKYQAVLGDLDLHLDYAVLGLFSVVGIVGSVLGGHVGARLDQRLLRRIFALLLLVMALGMGVATLHGMLTTASLAVGR
nr:TSUP family transporter [Planctomycetota bacterium]